MFFFVKCHLFSTNTQARKFSSVIFCFVTIKLFYKIGRFPFGNLFKIIILFNRVLRLCLRYLSDSFLFISTACSSRMHFYIACLLGKTPAVRQYILYFAAVKFPLVYFNFECQQQHITMYGMTNKRTFISMCMMMLCSAMRLYQHRKKSSSRTLHYCTMLLANVLHHMTKRQSNCCTLQKYSVKNRCI